MAVRFVSVAAMAAVTEGGVCAFEVSMIPHFDCAHPSYGSGSGYLGEEPVYFNHEC